MTHRALFLFWATGLVKDCHLVADAGKKGQNLDQEPRKRKVFKVAQWMHFVGGPFSKLISVTWRSWRIGCRRFIGSVGSVSMKNSK